MLTFVIDGESHQVTAEQFRGLVEVSVRMLSDASRHEDVEFTIGQLHASAPTISWEARATEADSNVQRETARVGGRIAAGARMLERDEGVPEWMTGTTARTLYRAAAGFGETPVEGVTFESEGKAHKLTRRTYRTLDRVLHEETDALGSIAGTLVTATLRGGAHVTVEDEVHGRGVECYVARPQLRQASQLIGERVTVAGRLRRDYRGRPRKIMNARVEAAPQQTHVSVSEMGGAFEGGPDSVAWLREQRGD